MDKKYLTDKPVFIVSTGRAGSTMIAQVLALHPRILALHEPHPHLRTEAYVRWKRVDMKETVKRRIRKKREDLINQVLSNRLVYAESSNYASMLIEELYDLFDARFIHLYRNGRDFVVSGLQRGWYIDNTLKTKMKNWLRRRFFLDTGKTAQDNLLDPPGHLGSRLEKIAWLWVEINKNILEKLERLPEENRFSFSLECLNKDRIEELLDFIGVEKERGLIDDMLSVAMSRPNRTKTIKIPEEDVWTEENIKRFYSIAGDMMKRLGYE